ncbi:putative DNA replication licensing factor MCM4 [Operophtera brumata]|uniref:Putative DNA replication licensing factor MCM4 n=1 Tax=Operophtera brumata TaxID=104452 RepID=A0A0L7LBP4_OPEBR|nr:putative DNA replication licensing factor MCM4 [Operophtera brumata]
MSLMRDYIAFAIEHVQPTLSELAQQRLIDAYVDMRSVHYHHHELDARLHRTVSREHLDEALRDLQDEGKVVIVSHTHLRLC